MLRYVGVTLCALYIVLSLFGRDLTGQEQAELDARRAAKTPIFASLMETLNPPSLRQGDFVPTLAALARDDAQTPADPAPAATEVKIASLDDSALIEHVTETLAARDAVEDAPVAPVVEPDPIVVREVTASRVNVRSGPSTSFEVLGQVTRAEIVEIVGDPDAAWVEIRVEGDGVAGFMSGRFLTDVQ